MILYDTGTWGFGFLFRCKGSVIPKGLAWGLPAGAAAAVLSYVLRHELEWEQPSSDMGLSLGVSSYNLVLGFLVVFRTQQAYSRWWEGGTLLQEVRGEWFNAYSSCLAFSSREEEKAEEVFAFQQLLCRLFSLLFVSALHQVSNVEGSEFEVLDFTGMDMQHIELLDDAPNRVEVILQWLQRLIVCNLDDQVISVAPPILTRVFQELSRGMVKLNNCRKIKEFQFPFPYTQMMGIMLLCQIFLMILVTGVYCRTPAWAGALTFLCVSAFWTINYIAQEIEQPFGDDKNHLPLELLQLDFNQSMSVLVNSDMQQPPQWKRRDLESGSESVRMKCSQFSIKKLATAAFEEDENAKANAETNAQKNGFTPKIGRMSILGGGDGRQPESRKRMSVVNHDNKRWSIADNLLVSASWQRGEDVFIPQPYPSTKKKKAKTHASVRFGHSPSIVAMNNAHDPERLDGFTLEAVRSNHHPPERLDKVLPAISDADADAASDDVTSLHSLDANQRVSSQDYEASPKEGHSRSDGTECNLVAIVPGRTDCDLA